MTEDKSNETSQAEVSGQETNGQGYITKAEFEAAFKEFSNGLTDKIGKNYQGLQSQTDRYQDRVQKRVQEIESVIELMRRQGRDVPDQELQRLRNDAILEELARGEAKEELPGQETPPEGSEQALINWTNAEAERLEKEAGVEILEDDPEAKMLDEAAEKSPYDFLKAMEQAIQTKKERLGKTQQANVAAMPGLAGSGSPSSNPLEGVMDPDVLWERAVKEGKL